jgi:hypothetical protein
MKRYAMMICAALGVLVASQSVQATGLTYGGYQPWWNIFAKKNKCLTPEEERLQRFWHDYYHALKCYYGSLDKIDWVAYYKNHGYQINTGPYGMGACGQGGCPRVNYAPVFVSPTMQWAVPNSCIGQGAGGCGPAGCGQPMMQGGY